MSVKINRLDIENVKRVRAVSFDPLQNGLTIIGGKNEQGKTSVIDGIAWALGGDRFRPSNPQNSESVIPPTLRVELSNGLIVERKGKNSDLRVFDPSGQKAGQTLLNEFVEQLALDLPRFMEASNSEKAKTLLRVIGLEDQIEILTREQDRIYNERLLIGREADKKKKYAEELKEFHDVPDEPISVSELIQEQQAILARNGENNRKRQQLQEITRTIERLGEELDTISKQIEALQKKQEEKFGLYNQAVSDEIIARKTVEQLKDESTEELEASIENAEIINEKIRTNQKKADALKDAEALSDEYKELSEALQDARTAVIDLLKGAKLPLPELSVEDGELTYKGHKWDAMSGSQRLKVGTAIVRAINPKCGFVLLDKLEQMDTDTLKEFGAWLEGEGLQVIATRVSTGDECQIIITDGLVEEDKLPKAQVVPEAPKWEAGRF